MQKDIEKRKEEFINKAKKIHPRGNIDYSKVVYVNNRTKVELYDNDLRPDGTPYGTFWQTPSNHLKGREHPDKKNINISIKKAFSTKDIINKFKEVHKGEGLDYSQVEYKNMHTKVKIIDPEYGEFWQEPAVHLKGCKHPKRAANEAAQKISYDTEHFIKLVKEVCKDKNYSFEKVKYISSQTKIIVTCHNKFSNGKEHGDFEICPDALLQGKGCPICGHHLSKNEDEIYKFIVSLIGEENVERHNHTILDGKELDIYIPSKHVGIEYNGLRWHSDAFVDDKSYHLKKLVRSNENGVKLIQIFEDEYLNNKDLILKKIKYILGFSNDLTKIDARKCEIKDIDNKTAFTFFNKNHIQGFVSSSVYKGCFYNGKLIAAMSFLKEGDNKWNLTRYATDNDYICRGCAGKLFNSFIKEYNPSEIKSFADRRWTTDGHNNLYIKLGFKLDKIEPPNYQYYCPKYYGNKRVHKFNFRKKRLHNKFGFPMSMTEKEMCEKIDAHKIWDCGLFKYVWKKINNKFHASSK